jgi:hypothetical protein
MPATTSLPEKCRETLGEAVTAELAAWLERVTLASRTGLRELNDVNLARADAALRQRVAELRHELALLETRLGNRLGETAGRVDRGLGEHDVRQDARLGRLRVDLVKWMFLFWLGTLVPVAALIARLG